MKKTVQMIAVLVVIGLLAGTSLAGMFLWTRARISENERQELQTRFKRLFPGSTVTELDVPGDFRIFEAKDEGGELKGYAFLADGQGYQGQITLVCAVSPDLQKMVGLEVMPTRETPGLGQKIEGDTFKDQFKGLDVTATVLLTKGKPTGDDQVEAITGATISSTAVVEILNKGTAKARELLKQLPNR